MSAKHTPGPWTLDEDRTDIHGDPRVLDALGRQVISSVVDWHDDYATPEQKAEVRATLNLIAAAPDLLAACEVALEDLQMRALDEQPMPGQMVAAERLRTAIAKARGGA